MTEWPDPVVVSPSHQGSDLIEKAELIVTTLREYTYMPWSQTGAWEWDMPGQEAVHWVVTILAAQAPAKPNDDLLGALDSVNKIISEAAMTGFNCKDGDWAERLFASQQRTSRALKAARAAVPSADRGSS